MSERRSSYPSRTSRRTVAASAEKFTAAPVRRAPRQSADSEKGAGKAAAGRKPALIETVRLMVNLALATKPGPDGASPCVPFPGGARDADGYGAMRFNGNVVRAHRVAFKLAKGTMPRLVRHSCDVRDCIQPRHLLAGTVAQNVADTVARGRSNPGAARLTAEEVAVIRRAIEAGISCRRIAREYGKAKATIDDIAHRHTWTKVEAAPAEARS